MFHRLDFNPMEQRFAGIIKYERATAHFFYLRQSSFASIVHDFKYRKFPTLARYMGRLTAQELLSSGFFSGIDCLIPVPLHPLKYAKRGYNQSQMIAKGISDVTDIPINNSLKAVRHHSTQTAKSHYLRWKNTQGVFKCKKVGCLKGKHILIVDDVCTTGATMIAAAQAFSAHSDIKISILALAVTRQ